jgi:hypothetical protein
MFGKRGARAFSAIATCGAAASIAAFAVAPAAVAAVSHPKAGSYSQLNKAGDRSKMELSYSKGHVTYAEHYDKCVRVPIMLPKVKVSEGKFSYSGKADDVVGHKWKVHLDGAFVTRTKATGHWSAKQLTGGSCASTFTYKVTWEQS